MDQTIRGRHHLWNDNMVMPADDTHSRLCYVNSVMGTVSDCVLCSIKGPRWSCAAGIFDEAVCVDRQE